MVSYCPTHGECHHFCLQHSPLWYALFHCLLAFWVNLDDEMDIRAYKHIDATDNEEINNKWVPKTSRAPANDDGESDEEAGMDILPSSATDALSPTIVVSLDGASFSAATFDYASVFQSLKEHLNTIFLDVQQMRLDHQEDICTLTSNFHVY